MFHSVVQFFKQRSNSIYVSNGIVLLYRFFSSKDQVPARYRSFKLNIDIRIFVSNLLFHVSGSYVLGLCGTLLSVWLNINI